ncbi:MAG: autoinducer binding domain-containing protein [Rhizobiaceae bacterium]
MTSPCEFRPARFVEALSACQTSYDVLGVLKDVCSAFGYSGFIAFRLPWLTDNTLSGRIIVTNWAPELIRACNSLGFLSESPVIARLRRSTLPFAADLADIAAAGDDEKRKTARDAFREHGHVNGVFLPCCDRDGRRGAVGFTGDETMAATEELAELSYLAAHVYERLAHVAGAAFAEQSKLTVREKECIVWTAEGKTSAEAAQILGLSENTVNHYLASAAGKLGTVNKAHTVARAISGGLLSD